MNYAGILFRPCTCVRACHAALLSLFLLPVLMHNLWPLAVCMYYICIFCRVGIYICGAVSSVFMREPAVILFRGDDEVSEVSPLGV